MSFGWHPPPDPEKPNCPYISGFQTEIKTHTPPPPFGGPRYSPPNRAIMTDVYLRSAIQSKHVILHPFQVTPAPSMSKLAQLTVVKPLNIGNSRGAQVLLCSTREASYKPFEVVAKIFDPLYYSWSASHANIPVDTVRRAEADYSREAAAYQYLDKVGLTGTFAPKYFGSWTFTLPLKVEDKVHQRSVRLVLIEYIDGVSMISTFAQNQGPRQEYNAYHLDLKYRLEVLARVLDGLAKQTRTGLYQGDLAPRNIMLCPSPRHQPGQTIAPSRVVLIDYNVAWVEPVSKNNSCELPMNPLLTTWRSAFQIPG